MNKIRYWLLNLVIDYLFPLNPDALHPEDKLNLAHLYESDLYRSLKKMMDYDKFMLRGQALSATDAERENYRGQYLAWMRLHNTLKKLNQEHRRKNRS